MFIGPKTCIAGFTGREITDFDRTGLRLSGGKFFPKLVPGRFVLIVVGKHIARLACFYGLSPPYRGNDEIENPLIGHGAGLVPHRRRLLRLHHVHGDLGKIANDRVDVAAHVPDLGEFCRLEF
jgi:hypothetical protein